MHSLISKNSLYTVSLVFIPMLVLMSWVNVYFGNTNYGVISYLATFILPAVILSFGVAYLTADWLAEGYGYSSGRVLFSLVGLILLLLLFSYVFSFFGIRSLFVTAMIPSSPDAQDDAAKFYSLELAGSLVLLALLYTIASYIFRTKNTKKKKQETVIWELEDEEPVVKKVKKAVKKKSVKKSRKKKV